MRTGKNRTFVVDNKHLENVERKRQEGKGLVGGDLTRIPGPKRGLAQHLDFDPIPEIRRFQENPDEVERQNTYLSHRPLEVEIGFGGGNFILSRAQQEPDTHFVGFEIRRQFCLSLARQIHRAQLPNLRVCYEDVRQAMPSLFPDASIKLCSVFFPDPWWKKKHLKRRLLTPTFLDLMSEKLCEGGILHVKTDVLPYGENIQELFDADERFQPCGPDTDPLFTDLPLTEREQFCVNKQLPFSEFRYTYKG